MVRMVNDMDNNLVDLNARITMSWLENDQGTLRRRFANLPLEIDTIYMFPLNWTIIHRIDAGSPLYGKSRENLVDASTEFLLMVRGYDNTYAKAVHANRSYTCQDLIYGASFLPMYETRNKKTILHLHKIHDIKELELED